MIINDLQFQITKNQIDAFEEQLRSIKTDTHPRIHQAQREAIESQLDDLREELAEYECSTRKTKGT
jgi:hypothetical protein